MAKVNKTGHLHLRLTPEEHAELTALAKAAGLSKSEFVRKWALAVKGSAQQGVYASEQRKLEKKGQLRLKGTEGHGG